MGLNDQLDQLSAIAILLVFLFGITIGLVASVSWASRLEDGCHSLLDAAPSVLCEGVRVFQRLYVGRDRWPANRPPGPGGTRTRPGRHGPDEHGTETQR
jgi:hypothetical protein